MENHKILLTGDFWNQDFRSVLSSFDAPVTLVSIENIESVSDGSFDLIIVAQSRRNQIQSVDIEKLQAIFSNAPIVNLMGSWCEGEIRSGKPAPGLVRIYWHQWEGRYAKFVSQLQESGLTDWHAPRTSSVADRIGSSVNVSSNSISDTSSIEYVGISAWTKTQYEMIADAILHFGWQARWVERAVWDAESTRVVSAICVDADSWSNEVRIRINWIRTEIPDAPVILLLNYPRAGELDEILAAGVTKVVSKPFELVDLRFAITCSVEQVQPAYDQPQSLP